MWVDRGLQKKDIILPLDPSNSEKSVDRFFFEVLMGEATIPHILESQSKFYKKKIKCKQRLFKKLNSLIAKITVPGTHQTGLNVVVGDCGERLEPMMMMTLMITV